MSTQYKKSEEVPRPKHEYEDLFTADQVRQAQREAVAAYKAELFQKYESNTERATEAEGEAFTHGYFCGEREAVAADREQWAEYLKEGQTPLERFQQERKDLDALMGLYQKAVAVTVPEGYKLVPIEPTEEMLNATYAGQHCSDIWRDMLAAAPEVKP